MKKKKVMQKIRGRTIDITNYDDFIAAGFIECPKCNSAYDPEYFEGHSCMDFKMPREYTPLPTVTKSKSSK